MNRSDDPAPSRAGAAMLALALEITATFFRLRAAGKKVGAVTPSGGGILGLLRSLALEGPQPVPALARSRPVARQHIQRLANEAAADGLIEFIGNPAHKRSKLLRLTGEGERFYAELMGRLATLAENLAGGMEADEIESAAAVLRRLRGKLQQI